jgi:hypothetical protein
MYVALRVLALPFKSSCAPAGGTSQRQRGGTDGGLCTQKYANFGQLHLDWDLHA